MRATENPHPKTKQESIFTVESNINIHAVQWREGTLSFNDAPLADVINAVEERYNVQIEIVGNAPKGLRNNQQPTLTAEFNNNQTVDAVCAVISKALEIPLTVVK